ncbi:unnamed protein product [Ectocarpus fasciculatus]
MSSWRSSSRLGQRLLQLLLLCRQRFRPCPLRVPRPKQHSTPWLCRPLLPLPYPRARVTQQRPPWAATSLPRPPCLRSVLQQRRLPGQKHLPQQRRPRQKHLPSGRSGRSQAGGRSSFYSSASAFSASDASALKVSTMQPKREEWKSFHDLHLLFLGHHCLHRQNSLSRHPRPTTRHRLKLLPLRSFHHRRPMRA